MKKYYIPTSTLNFNNILSSESISPKAFYVIRGFGYSRWQEVEENNQENVVLLYDKPFSFTRPASDVEDHPMLVEITTDKDYSSLSSGVYYSDESIYLSPWRTRFIFFTEQDKRVALSISDSSLETKMLGLYNRQLYVESHSEVKHEPLTCNVPLNKVAVDFDIRVNKMKGLLYGYYIGALLSTKPELAERANTLQEIQNVFSSILSSDSRKPTVLQYQKLTCYFESLKKYDPIVSYLKNVAKEDIKVEDVVSGLEKLGVVFPFMLDGERIISSLEFATDKYNPAYDWLKKEKESLRQQEKEECQYLATSSEEIILSDNALSKINNSHLSEEKEQQLMKAWVNESLSSPEYNGKITTFAEALSDVVTKKAKEIYADGWDDSRAKTELNQMRRYIRAQESSITWQNDLFSAMAAVLAKGSDWEQLRGFMQSKLISDYRIPFAFYGELNGFANLTRDFTDNLFELRNNKNYIAEVYREIYGQLHGIDPTVVDSTDDSTTEGTPVVNQDTLEDRVNEIIKLHPRIKISEKDWKTIKWGVDNAHNDDIAFINMIYNEIENPKKGIFPYLQKELHPNFKPVGKHGGSQRNRQVKQPSLFTDNAARYVEPPLEKEPENKTQQMGFEYRNIEGIISFLSVEFGYEKKVLATIKKDLLWILDPKYSEHLSTHDLIMKFREQLIVGRTQRVSSKGKDMTWKNELYQSIDIDAIINSLEKRCL